VFLAVLTRHEESLDRVESFIQPQDLIIAVGVLRDFVIILLAYFNHN